MPGVTDTPPFNAAAADGVTLVFNFTFFVYEEGDIKVYSVLNDVETEITAGITKAITSSFIGGTVTFAVSPLTAVGDILIRREVGYDQTTEFADLTRFKETAIETALNNLSLQIQQINSKADLSLQYSETANITDRTMEAPVDGTVLEFSGTTGRVKSGASSSDITNAAANATAAAASAAAALVSEAAALVSELAAAASANPTAQRVSLFKLLN